MSKRAIFLGIVVIAAASLLGCSDRTETAGTGGEHITGAAYLLSERPAETVGVEKARENISDGEEVAVEGRIGGSAKPFVDGLAAFTIVDPNLKWCSSDERCPTPWDYCCADKSGKMAMVKVVGTDGQPVSEDARELLGVKELSSVVASGKAKRDDQGNLTVLAERVHVVQE